MFAAALAARALYVLSIHSAYFFTHLQTNPLQYHQWATLILDAPVPPHPPFEQSPGYPYFIAALYAALGRTVMAVASVQVVLGSLTCVFIAVAGRRWFGERTGLIAGLLAALYGPFLYFTGELVPATLFLFTITAAVVAALPPATNAETDDTVSAPVRGSAWVLAGCLWSTALIVRSNAVLALPFVLLDAWRRGRRFALWRIGTPLLLCVAAFIAVNASISHKLVVFTSNGGFNLWLGNNPTADGVSPFISGPQEGVTAEIRRRAADAVDADAIFRSKVVSFWTRDPAAGLRLAWKKFVWTWTDRELPNNADIGWRTSQSWLFRLPLLPLPFGIVLPLALAGVMLVRRSWRSLLLLGALLSIGAGTCVIFFTNARFRLAIAPAALICAAAALDRLPSMLRGWRRHSRDVVLAASAAGVGLVLAWANFYGIRDYHIAEIDVNTGVLEREAGNFEAAIAFLRRGLAQEPTDPIGWVHLALALEQEGLPRQALEAYVNGLASTSDDPTVYRMADQFLRRHRVDSERLDEYLSKPESEDARQRFLDLIQPPAR